MEIEYIVGEKYKEQQERQRLDQLNEGHKQEKAVGYTQWNCTSVLLVSLFGIEALMPLVLCSCIGVVTSFHLGFFLEPTGVARLIKQNNLPSGWRFHVINSIIHVGPVFWMGWLVMSRSLDVRLADGLWAACLHLSWGLFQTKGTLLLDKVYAPMSRFSWYAMWTTAVTSEIILTPWFFD
eukprot:m.38726 g.38726  ORF g.38726 m.38726 type:complete len:180 (-) comp6815_c2_seq1:74-613(-)